jgi:hypothetical protein
VCALIAAMVEVHRMSAIEIGLLRDERRLRVVKDTLVVLTEAERVAVFTESVDVGVARQVGPQAHVLLLEDERHSRGIEQDLAILLTLDGKRKRLLYDVELKDRAGRGNVVVHGSGEDVLVDLENLKSSIKDLDVKTLVYTVSMYCLDIIRAKFARETMS